MFIHRVDLVVSDLASAVSFFTEVMELPAGRLQEDSVEVTVGRSILRLSEGPATAGVHHLAFDVAPEAFAQHRDWMASKGPLLIDADGQTEFEGPPVWRSRSIYFTGPDRMVLELIARRERPRPDTQFPGLISISEVGIAVSDVAATTRLVGAATGATVLGTAAPQFAPVGDHDGLLILVTTGRGWLPAFDTHAEPLSLRVHLSGTSAQDSTVQLNELATLQVD